jgi:hypothetical protein
MIRHFVLLRFRDDVTAEAKRSIYDALSDLKNHIPGVRDFHAGPNVSVEAEMVRGFRDAFWFDFDNASVRDAYLVHPLHQAAGAAIVAQTEGGPEGVIVVDMEV